MSYKQLEEEVQDHDQQLQIQFPSNPSAYKIVSEIGSGPKSIVYKAMCLSMGPSAPPVAIKSVDLKLSRAWKKSTLISTSFSHPNVLGTHCSFEVVEQGRIWIVMPLMSSGSLASIVASEFFSELSERAIASILRQTLAGLSYIHQQGHLHRNVKARNILIDSTASFGSVKLSDFFVFPGPINEEAEIPYWLAPEVIVTRSSSSSSSSLNNKYTAKSDIWSFGIVALELFHGRSPPVSAINKENRKQVHKEKFSKDFKEVISLCLNRDPEKRPTAESLKSHSFFANSATEGDNMEILRGLPSVEERFFRVSKNKKSDEEVRNVKKIIGWNFNADKFELEAVFLRTMNIQVQPGVLDKEKVLRDLFSLRTNLEIERKTLSDIFRVMGSPEIETREEYLERTVVSLRSEIEAMRRKLSQLELKVEFLKIENIQLRGDKKT